LIVKKSEFVKSRSFYFEATDTMALHGFLEFFSEGEDLPPKEEVRARDPPIRAPQGGAGQSQFWD